jgi:hypothetical protein
MLQRNYCMGALLARRLASPPRMEKTDVNPRERSSCAAARLLRPLAHKSRVLADGSNEGFP